MTGFAAIWLVLLAAALVAVIAVRSRAARVIRAASAPEAGWPTGEALGRELLAACELDVVRIVAADVDAYRAIPREIQLADGRFDHGSPASRAVVALEVAHAAQHASGFTPWRRWWVISGHTVWAGPLLLITLLALMISSWPLLVLPVFVCVAVLALSGVLSLLVEYTAIETARELLADASIDGAGHADADAEADATIDHVLRWAARAYVAESIFDVGFLDRAIEPFRGPSWGSPPMSG